MTRRRFLTLGSGALAGMACAAYPMAESRWFHVTNHTVTLPGLPRSFSGMRVAVIADVHHGMFFPLSYVEKVVSAANKLKPDAIFLAGDYIYHEAKYIPPVMNAFGQLKAPLGVFAALGNHDIKISRSLSSAQLHKAGIREVTNTGFWIKRGSDRLLVCGLDDLLTGRPNLPMALSQASEKDRALLLSHNPDVVEKISDPRVLMAFCGHTHGGQVYIPFVGSPIIPSEYGQKYRYGLVTAPHIPVYVTSGVGTIFPPVRIFCPPEIACLTLQSSV